MRGHIDIHGWSIRQAGLAVGRAPVLRGAVGRHHENAALKPPRCAVMVNEW